MNTLEDQKTIADLQEQLHNKQAELDGVQAKLAAVLLKNMAGLGGQVEELTSLNEQLAVAKDKVGDVKRQAGRLAELEQLLENKQAEIARLQGENSSLKSRLTNGPAISDEPENGPPDRPDEPIKTALQIRIEKMHNDLLVKEKKEEQLAERKMAEQEGVKICSTVSEEEEKEEEIEIAQPIEPGVPAEITTVQAIDGKRETTGPVRHTDEQELGSGLLPDDVLLKWLRP